MAKFSKVEQIETQQSASGPIYHLHLSCGHTKTLTRNNSDRRDYERAPSSTRQKCATCNPIDTTGPKACIDCNQEKPRTEFYRSKGTIDGYQKRCKPCQKEYQQEIFRKNLKAKKRMQRTNPRNKKTKAKELVEQAVYAGVLIKPEKCEECGLEGLIQGHHDDYDMPLEVRWLCRQCHVDWHQINGEGLNATDDPNERYIYANDVKEAILSVGESAYEVAKILKIEL